MIIISISLRNGDKINMPFSTLERATEIFIKLSNTIKDNADNISFSNEDNVFLIAKSSDICSVFMKHEPNQIAMSKQQIEVDTLRDLQIEHLKTITKLEKLRLEEVQRENRFKDNGE